MAKHKHKEQPESQTAKCPCCGREFEPIGEQEDCRSCEAGSEAYLKKKEAVQ